MGVVIDVDKLWTVFGRQVVHENLDMQVAAGEIVSIVGGSGSGKTTLLREMIGLLPPSKGKVRIFGHDITKLARKEKRALSTRWGVLFQHGALFTAFNVFDNIAFPLRELKALDEPAIEELVMLKLALVGLAPEDAVKMPAELSGGMIKRVALARAMSMEAELLFLDEPTAGLDPVAASAFDQLVVRLSRELNLTVVMITHDLDTIHDACDKVAVLADRKVVAYGPLQEVAEVQHPFIQRYFHGLRGGRLLSV